MCEMTSCTNHPFTFAGQASTVLLVYSLMLFYTTDGLNVTLDDCRKLYLPTIDVPKTPGDNGFRLKIVQDLDTYVAGQNYTSKISSYQSFISPCTDELHSFLEKNIRFFSHGIWAQA